MDDVGLYNTAVGHVIHRPDCTTIAPTSDPAYQMQRIHATVSKYLHYSRLLGLSHSERDNAAVTFDAYGRTSPRFQRCININIIQIQVSFVHLPLDLPYIRAGRVVMRRSHTLRLQVHLKQEDVPLLDEIAQLSSRTNLISLLYVDNADLVLLNEEASRSDARLVFDVLLSAYQSE